MRYQFERIQTIWDINLIVFHTLVDPHPRMKGCGSARVWKKSKIRRAVNHLLLPALFERIQTIANMEWILSKFVGRNQLLFKIKHLDIQQLYPYMQSQENLGATPSQTFFLLFLGFGFGAGKATTSSSDCKTFSPKIIFKKVNSWIPLKKYSKITKLPFSCFMIETKGRIPLLPLFKKEGCDLSFTSEATTEISSSVVLFSLLNFISSGKSFFTAKWQ